MSKRNHGGSLERTTLPIGHSLLLSGDSENGGGITITKRMPQSSVLGRLQAFLPEIKRANAELASSAQGTSDPIIAEHETPCDDGSRDQPTTGAVSADVSAAVPAASRAHSEGADQEQDSQESSDNDACVGNAPASAQAASAGGNGGVEMSIAMGLWDNEATEAAAIEAIEERSGEQGVGHTNASSAPAPPVIQELHNDSADSRALPATKHKHERKR